jgi:hypothetical protein
VFLPPIKVATVWVGFVMVQVSTAACALHLDRERYGPLWSLPLQQVVYRQLMYLVVFQSTVMAMLGGRLRWSYTERIGLISFRGDTNPLPSRQDTVARARQNPERQIGSGHSIGDR